MRILCDRCKREFEAEEDDIRNLNNKMLEIICPDCEEDADI